MSSLADRRRNLGPTDVVPLDIAESRESEQLYTKLRPVFVSQGIAAHASGSSYYESGGLKLHATVHGPRQARGDFSDKAEIEVNVNIAEFSGISLRDDLSHAVADFIRSSITPAIVLKEYPKSKITISLTVLNGESQATLLSGAVNAVVMALVNAGIAMYDIVTAVSTSILSSDAEVYVDSDFRESSADVKQLVAVYSVSTEKLVSMLVTSQSEVSANDLRTLLNRAGTAAKERRNLLDSFLVEDYVSKSQSK